MRSHLARCFLIQRILPMSPKGALHTGLLLCWAMGMLLLSISPVASQGHEADLQWALSEQLLARGEPYRAITEYERFLFYFPSDPRAGLARVRILESYVAGKWWPEAARAARETLGDAGLPPELRCRTLELLGVCLMRMGDSAHARETLHSALETCQDPPARDRVRLLLAELGANLGQWGAAARALEAVEGEGPHARVAREESARIHRGELSSRERSPWMAGALAALLPGAGHAYLGRWEDAALVFTVNGAFLGATVEALEKDQPALAGAMALAELLWYSGNIFGAVSSAHKHNRVLAQQWAEGTRSQLDFSGQRP